ncbi:MAG: hypothetical protein HYT73_02285 [Candidatus Aenigmarchaeota archaeon]|nr:hypothetical protein [Candidatus Aenigmarchaeota archaeon]
MKILTPLDRRQLLIQIKDNVDGCQAVVPAHPEVLRLDGSVLTDETYAMEALRAIREHFETDSGAYIEALISMGYHTRPSLKLDEYRRWNDGWRFTFSPFNEVLSMRWELDEPEPYEIGLCPMVCITNGIVLEEHGNIAEIDEVEIAPNVGIIYGSTHEDDRLLIPHETMLEYEHRTALTQKVHKESVLGTYLAVSAFCSSYTRNVPQALLMRNWAVDYHNRLLEKAIDEI